MADFCITAVKYNEDHSHIAWLHVKENQITKLGPTRVVPRAFVADLIRLGKVTFETATRTTNNEWELGPDVHLIDGMYLSTDRNNKKSDNLAELPEF